MISIAVILYQLLFVLILFVASRMGPAARIVALTLCLLWTATHLFFPPLAVLQTLVIVASFLWFKPAPKASTRSTRTEKSE